MATLRRVGLIDWLLFFVILAAAGGARAWYFYEYADRGNAKAVWQVQDDSPAVEGLPNQPNDSPVSTESEVLIANLKQDGMIRGFRGYAPLGPRDEPEPTAHLSPGYPIFRALIEKNAPQQIDPLAAIRWIQVGLGSLAAGFYFLLAQRAFDSRVIGFLAGVFCALNPFWIVNAAELNDGVLVSFLLAGSLALGARGGQQGGALTSFLYGLFLAALTLVRAALLPFSLVALLWFVVRSRKLPAGWLYAILAVLGFICAIGPWSFRNFNEFDGVVPIADSAWWHIWVGNNPQATGGPWVKEMEKSLSPERLAELQQLVGKDQPQRYAQLKQEVLEETQREPVAKIERRLFAGLYFFASAGVMQRTGIVNTKDVPGDLPPWLKTALYGTLVGMLLLAALGWRWSYARRRSTMPLQLAVLWIPLPYILSHAEWLHGPRLPLDGPLLCLAAYALLCCIPGLGGKARQAEPVPETEEVVVPT